MKKAKLNKGFFYARIRFDRKDYARIETAALRRGLSAPEFIRMACNFAAVKVMSKPVDDALGLGDIGTASSSEEAAA